MAVGSRNATDTRSELDARFDRAFAISPGAVRFAGWRQSVS
jgi:hypothetical protein